jgi:hypothetical protein
VQGVGLCHGISGNGFALLAMARSTGQPHYLRAARAFALYAAQHWQELYEVPDRPASLFEVRMCCVCVCGGCVAKGRRGAWAGVSYDKSSRGSARVDSMFGSVLHGALSHVSLWVVISIEAPRSIWGAV